MSRLSDKAAGICDANSHQCQQCQLNRACPMRAEDDFNSWAERMNAAAESIEDES